MSVPNDIVKAKTCCFTGHRGRDLPFGGDRNSVGMKNLISVLYLKIEEAGKDGFDTFISGMADGVDMICAEIVYDLMQQGHGIRLICAVPYPGQSREIKNLRDRYLYGLLTGSCPTLFVSGSYSKDCYKERNQFMVDSSSRIIAVLKNKEKGSGTIQTINMAKRAGIDCRIVRLDDNPLFYIGS